MAFMGNEMQPTEQGSTRGLHHVGPLDGIDDDLDLGGERACWLDKVCSSCGALDGHRAGCDLAVPERDSSTRDASNGTPPPDPADDDG